MNSIQKYALNSLFERNQITEETLAKALDSLSNETAIDAFLHILITGEDKNKESKEDNSHNMDLLYKKQFIITCDTSIISKTKLIVIIKEVFDISLCVAKNIVNEHIPTYNPGVYTVLIPTDISREYTIMESSIQEVLDKLEGKGLEVHVINRLR